MSDAPTSGQHDQAPCCLLCGYVYEEARGDPSQNVPPGTPWNQVPEEWRCPECSATKNEFDGI